MSGIPPTQPLRDEHRELLPHVELLRSAADHVGAVPPARLEAELDNVLDFLVGHLIPHAQAEDAALYPVVEKAMGAPGAADTMRRDHVEVVRLTEELAQIRGRIAAQAPSAYELDLRRVLYGLYAVVELHFAKEEEVYLPVLDAWLDAASAARMFEAMERAASDAKANLEPAAAR